MVADEVTSMMQHCCSYFIQIPVNHVLGLNRVTACKNNSQTPGGEHDKAKQGRQEAQTLIKMDNYNNITAPRAVMCRQRLPNVAWARN